MVALRDGTKWQVENASAATTRSSLTTADAGNLTAATGTRLFFGVHTICALP